MSEELDGAAGVADRLPISRFFRPGRDRAGAIGDESVKGNPLLQLTLSQMAAPDSLLEQRWIQGVSKDWKRTLRRDAPFLFWRWRD